MSSSVAHYVLLLLGIGMCIKAGLGLSLKDKVALYQNCSIFDNPDIYGGPICGDNGVTYANGLYLDCKNHHSQDIVATLHSGPCLENEKYCSVDLHYEPVCGSDHKIYTNMQSLLCVRHKQSKDLIAVSMADCRQNDHCYREGTEHYEVNPVCANNGFTYQNAAQLKCLQRYNPELQIIHDGGCRVEFVHQLYGAAVCDIAKVRYEWNPVCASDGVTYSNPFLFLCHHSHLKVISNGECDTHSHDSCVEAHTNTTILPNGEYVNEAFTADDEVCGNDGRTYQSIHHLQCQTRHDKYLFLKHHGPCSGPDDHPCGSIPEEDHRQPVCGTNGKSYISPEALWCAKLRSPAEGETCKSAYRWGETSEASAAAVYGPAKHPSRGPRRRFSISVHRTQGSLVARSSGLPLSLHRLRSLDRRRPSLESLLRRSDSFSPSRFCLALAPPCVVGWWGTDERGRTTVLPRIAEVVASFDVSRARRHSSHPLDMSGYPIGA